MRKETIILILIVISAIVLGGCATSQAKGGKPGKPGRDIYQCNDGVDNDGDGQCDFDGCAIKINRRKMKFPADTDCTSSTDNNEEPDCIPSAEYCDGADNDCDTIVDEDACTCVDPDYYQPGIGQNFGVYTKSTVTGSWWQTPHEYIERTDYCLSPTDISEVYCQSDGYVGQFEITCPNGCVDGACVMPEDSCYDTDGGVVLDVLGNIYVTANGTDFNLSDTCLSNGNIIERSCQGTIGASEILGCPTNSECIEGACVAASCVPTEEVCDGVDNDCDGSVDEECFVNSCVDSDNGININVFGMIYGEYNGTAYNRTDECTDSSSLWEYYCSGNLMAASHQACNNTVCENGRCI